MAPVFAFLQVENLALWRVGHKLLNQTRKQLVNGNVPTG
jgi:hypothetical protein